MDLTFLRTKVEKYFESGEWSNAIFWSEKLLSLPNSLPADLIFYIRSLIETEQYFRALSCIKRVTTLDKGFSNKQHPAVISSSTNTNDEATRNETASANLVVPAHSSDYDFHFNIDEDEQWGCGAAAVENFFNASDEEFSKKHKVLKYLAVKCLLGTKNYEEAVKLARTALDVDYNNASNMVMNSTALLVPNVCFSSNLNNNNNNNNLANLSTTQTCEKDYLDKLAQEWKIDAGLYLLAGLAYENMDNRIQARLAFEKCLKLDVYRFEALRRLNDLHLLTEPQKSQLIEQLLSSQQCPNERETKLLRYVYKCMIKQEMNEEEGVEKMGARAGADSCSAGGPIVGRVSAIRFDDDLEEEEEKDDQVSSTAVEQRINNVQEEEEERQESEKKKQQRHQNDSVWRETRRKLARNPSLLAAESRRRYYSGDFRRSYDLTSKILKREQFRFDCLPVHICCLVKLDKVNELFRLAHKLIEFYPEKAASWFAVACYYWSTGQMEPAKRFFDKCTLLESQSGEFWIGYGHAFAAEQEHDQAMNCYVKAAKLMTNSHLPLLYVGLEYASTNNLKLAAKFLNEALSMSPDDPHILHEMGVLMYRQENYLEAENNFRLAVNSLMKSKQQQSNNNGCSNKISRSGFSGDTDATFLAPGPSWEPLLNNLGHTLRKLKRYEEALQWHTRALCIQPQDASTLASLGYCNMFLERFETAIDFFHQSLCIRRDDTFVAGVLSKCMEIMCDPSYNGRPFFASSSDSNNGDDFTPKLTLPGIGADSLASTSSFPTTTMKLRRSSYNPFDASKSGCSSASTSGSGGGGGGGTTSASATKGAASRKPVTSRRTTATATAVSPPLRRAAFAPATTTIMGPPTSPGATTGSSSGGFITMTRTRSGDLMQIREESTTSSSGAANNSEVETILDVDMEM